MTIEEIRQQIEQRTGVPAYLLTGETAEDNILQARKLLQFKREHNSQDNSQDNRSTAEQFAEWFNGQYLPLQEDPERAALEDIAEAVRIENGGFPIVRDGGQITADRIPDSRPTREQFAEWLEDKTAWDPFRDPDGWKRII